MAQRIRIGAVEYLNARPLICDLHVLAPEAELVLAPPSRLADDLAAGRLDIALVPAIEFFRSGPYVLIPDIAIVSHGPVMSVTLFSRTPLAQVRSVAIDEGSRTSAALTRILLHERHGVDPEIVPLAMDQPAESAVTDAVLLIGDRAMRASLPGFRYSFDLGQEWTEWTDLPFVYAAWAARAGTDLGSVPEVLHEAKRRGREQVARIAHEEAARLRLDPAFCRRYLTNIIRFDLGLREQAGLRRYYDLACVMGLARRGVEITFYRLRSGSAAPAP